MLTVVRATRLRRNLTLFFGGLMAMLASWLFIAMLSKRLSKLTQGFNLLKLGHPNPQIKLSGQDEIAYLVQSFNDTATKLEEREKIVALEHESRLSDMKILAAGVAHEIRNPLAAISGMIDLVDRSITSNTLDRAHDLIDRSRQEIARMDIIIKDMMGYAKQPNINLVPTPIPSLLEEMAQIDHHCTLRMTKPLPQLPLDAIAIKTVLRNLLINAREATGPDGELVMGTRLYKKRLLIYVQDNGPGIPKTERSNIFTPFYSSKARGSGLGLAIAKNIINAHHGQLKYRTGSSGSLFVIGFNLPKE